MYKIVILKYSDKADVKKCFINSHEQVDLVTYEITDNGDLRLTVRVPQYYHKDYIEEHGLYDLVDTDSLEKTSPMFGKPKLKLITGCCDSVKLNITSYRELYFPHGQYVLQVITTTEEDMWDLSELIS